ncbi:hypothetical protein [Streptomyces sp. TLI_185]|uniref:hypothetical protein n=1 Tax=Streptomyces sp. TLI_185 TaxID=2485151 RepID=UPI00161BBFFE|nr:hypothetical protein [Streptomyces sp. TLI_185]
MDTQQASTSLLEPLRTAASALRRVPGTGAVSRATEGALDRIGAVSPQGRRIAVYTGAGVLGVAGVVEWPVALTGAAVAWLTQPKPHDKPSSSAGSGRTTSGTRGRTAATQTKKSTAPAKKATASAGKSTGRSTKSTGPASRSTAQKRTTSGPGKSTARSGSTGRRSSATG